jgi:hypothetical protein
MSSGPVKVPIDRSSGPATALPLTSRMVLCCVVGAASLTACRDAGSFRYSAGILANHTAGTILVTYSAHIVVGPDGTRYCRIGDDFFLGPPPTRSGECPSDCPLPRPYMRGVAVDKAACTASFQLGPSQAAYGIFYNEFCANHATDTTGGDLPRIPFFESLSITAGGRTYLWRGWAAVEQFERRLFGNCVFDFRSR